MGKHFFISPLQIFCSDLSKCDLKTQHCHKSAICVNDERGYSCKCAEGFSGNGKTCHGWLQLGELCLTAIVAIRFLYFIL